MKVNTLTCEQCRRSVILFVKGEGTFMIPDGWMRMLVDDKEFWFCNELCRYSFHKQQQQEEMANG